MGHANPSSVIPNSKCEGCFNYERDNGRTGVCTAGLQPFNCGDGETPYVGYTPIAHLSPDVPNAGAPTAHALTGANREPNDILPIVEQVLGAEAHQLVKGIVEKLEAASKEDCPRHRLHKSTGYESALDPGFTCTCEEAPVALVAKSLWSRLPNRQRVGLTEDIVKSFAEQVMTTDIDKWTGKVIGTTSSGKEVKTPPIHLLAKSNDLALQMGWSIIAKSDFSAKDHFEAAQLHGTAARREEFLGHHGAAVAHRRMVQLHSEAYKSRS